MFQKYQVAKKQFFNNPCQLIEIEKYITDLVNKILKNNLNKIIEDYNEASYLYPFWANYKPVDRGRAPKGDQVPWIEVGEHAVGENLKHFISLQYPIEEIGLPSGADDRFLIHLNKIETITNNLTDCAFLSIDIKSDGPRDNFDDTVVSPYQISGDGIWENESDNLINSPIEAKGKRVNHNFFPALPPIYVLHNGLIAPTIHLFIKPIYKMLSLVDSSSEGQPLEKIINLCVPNGLLLTQNPNYLAKKKYEGLFYPGKDDSKKDSQKVRARISFPILKQLGEWRYTEILC